MNYRASQYVCCIRFQAIFGGSLTLTNKLQVKKCPDKTIDVKNALLGFEIVFSILQNFGVT